MVGLDTAASRPSHPAVIGWALFDLPNGPWSKDRGRSPAAGAGEDRTMATLMTWFVPAPGAERDLLVTTIGALAAARAGPAFPPHVTIVPMYDSNAAAAVRTLKSLTEGLRPFEVTFPAFG